MIGINGGIGGVKIFDVSNMISNPLATTDFQGATMSFLSPDDTLDITTGDSQSSHWLSHLHWFNFNHFIGEITIASWKKPLLPADAVLDNATPSKDIFSEARKTGEWRTASNVLIDNRNDNTVTSTSARTSPAKFEVIFDRKNTQAFGGTSPSQGRNYVYSYLNMSVTLREVK